LFSFFIAISNIQLYVSRLIKHRIKIYIYCLLHTYPPLLENGRYRVREIGGLQFPMDNGTLITPWRRASYQVARRAINGWRGIKKKSNSLTVCYRVVRSKFIPRTLAKVKYKKFYKFCIAICYSSYVKKKTIYVYR